SEKLRPGPAIAAAGDESLRRPRARRAGSGHHYARAVAASLPVLRRRQRAIPADRQFHLASIPAERREADVARAGVALLLHRRQDDQRRPANSSRLRARGANQLLDLPERKIRAAPGKVSGSDRRFPARRAEPDLRAALRRRQALG